MMRAFDPTAGQKVQNAWRALDDAKRAGFGVFGYCGRREWFGCFSGCLVQKSVDL